MIDESRPLTIPAFLATSVERRGDEPALGTIRDGEVHWHTWREVDRDAQVLAAMLRIAGIQKGDRVAQVSENRYEWIVADLAMHLAGAVHVPLHTSLSGEQIAEMIDVSGSRVVFVSSAELLAKFSFRLTHGEMVFIHDEQDYRAEKALLGEPAVAPQLPTQGVQSNDLATILFTSGTTGKPRGVMLSQRNLASNAATMVAAFSDDRVETRLNILPLSHIYARTCDLYTWLRRGSRLVLGENRETLLRDCQLAKPTAFNCVPFVFQRIAERVRASGATDQAAALKAAFGGELKLPICGGAPVPPDVESWYADHGLPLLPGYGLTEASPVISMSTPDAHKIGTVGKPLPGVDVRIADDGEVLARGPNVMLGYWQPNGIPRRDDSIHDEWLYTGDLGELDADGFLTIRGRKKELIALSTGKKVSPTRVESLLTASPLIEQVAVFGDGRTQLVALIVAARIEGRVARNEEIGDEIKRCLACAAHEEQVRNFAIVDRPFSIEHGELTPKLSLCRKVIERNFAEQLGKI